MLYYVYYDILYYDILYYAMYAMLFNSIPYYTYQVWTRTPAPILRPILRLA